MVTPETVVETTPLVVARIDRSGQHLHVAGSSHLLRTRGLGADQPSYQPRESGI